MSQRRLLDVEYIQEKLDEGFHYTEEARGQDLVLVLGNTGVGKSTTCNYLLGYRMKEMKHNGRTVIDTVDETKVKIGHEVKSETLYAKSLVINSSWSLINKEEMYNPICLLDCPGFLGNRTIEDKVIESISTELAVRSARQIKGILILISLNILQETRVKELRELVKTLISLFKDPIEMVQYSIFIITKKYKYMPDDEAKEITIGALSSLKDFCDQQATRLRKNPNLASSDELTCIDFECMSTYFSAVLKNTDDIIFINPIDNGESRELILNQINGIKPRKGFFKGIVRAGTSAIKKAVGAQSEAPLRPITISDFSFSEGNEDRVKFNKALYDRAREGINLISNILTCSETYGRLYLEIEHSRTRLSTLKTLQVNLEKEITKSVEGKCHYSKVDFESIGVFESMIIENNKEIKSKEKEIKQARERKKELHQKLENINIDTPLLFVEKSIYNSSSWWQWFSWVAMDFEADTEDEAVPIISVEKEKRNGCWKNEVDERQIGCYKIRYESKYMPRPAEASIKTYIKTKDEAGNKISIKRIKEDLLHLSERRENLESEIDSLKSNNQALQATVTRAKESKEDYKNNLKQKLDDCQRDMHRLIIEIGKMEEDRKKAKESGTAYLEEFNRNLRKFNIVISIAALLEFPSMLIENFVSQYTEFLPYVNDYQCIFDENTSNFSIPAYEIGRKEEEEEKFILKDPITGEEIKDLVVTSAGTAFDVHTLLKQFDTNLKSPSSFIFTREDGSTEEIEFLKWQKVPDIQNYLVRLRNDKVYLSQNSTSEKPPVMITDSEINKLTVEQLQQQKDKLLKDIKKLQVETEEKETDLEKIRRRLEKLQSESEFPRTVLEDTD